jgi:arginyl-tRNA synthetase
MRVASSALGDVDLSRRALAGGPLDLLVDDGEMNLIKVIAQYPRQIAAAASAHEPHRIAFYLHDLASAFHSHWNRGKEQPHLRFVNEERRDLSRARLALTQALTDVLASGLRILGVSAPEEMR